MRNFLEASADYIKKSLAEGKTTEQLTENLVIPKIQTPKSHEQRFHQNLCRRNSKSIITKKSPENSGDFYFNNLNFLKSI